MRFNRVNNFLIGILALLAALVYLPLAPRMGLYNDDWYLMYDAYTQGANFFHEIYAIDRPARGYVMYFFYSVFGNQVFFYHLSAYVFRVLSAWALFWTMEMIWEENKQVNFVSSLLFLLYPGFLAQINPIDYQSQILSLCLAILSIACMVLSIKSITLVNKLLWLGVSILLGVVYPALVEYFIGLEILRFGVVVCLVLRSEIVGVKKNISKVLSNWLPSLTGPIVFLIWRIFAFTSERRATDIGAQLGQLFSSSITGARWLIAWLQDAVRVLFLAWTVPFDNFGFGMGLSETLIGLAIAIVVSLLVWLTIRELSRQVDAVQFVDDRYRQILILGMAAAVFALLPVIIANRRADFDNFSRYTLGSAAGASMAMAVLIFSVRSLRLRFSIVTLLVFIATSVHYANAVRAVQITDSVREFWWQVAWRAPDIKPGATLVASYPVGGIQEDYFVWGPANLIYYPNKQDVVPIEIKLPAAVLTNKVIAQIISGRGSETPLRRGNILTREFKNVLLLAQADKNFCVRVVDGRWSELSIWDQERVMLISEKSMIDNITFDGDTHQPPAVFFGTEPQHDWCFFYQKATLARQQGNWQQVVDLGNEAQKLGLTPNDPIEWMPFLQAYAVLGDKKQVKQLSTRVNTEAFYRQQACQTFTAMPGFGFPLPSDMQAEVNDLFCQ